MSNSRWAIGGHGADRAAIVDLTTDGVFVHRKPRGNRYEQVMRIEPAGVLDVETTPGLAIPAATLFA